MRKITVEGMSCSRCTGKIEDTLKALNGVEKVTTSLEKGEVYIKGTLNDSVIRESIEAQGYEVVSVEEVNVQKKPESVRKRGFLARLLDKIESSNSKSFGDKRLDCCNLQDKDKK